MPSASGAGLAVLEGRQPEALSLYRDAIRAWRSVGLPWDEALMCIDMARLLPAAPPDVQDAVASARAIFTRQHAAPFLALLEAAVGPASEQSATRPGPQPSPADGLGAR